MNQPLSILYIGELSEGGTCLQRMRILQELGHRIISFDITPWLTGGPRFLRSLAHRKNLGPPVWRLNDALMSYAEAAPPVTHLWVDRGRWIYPEVLQQLKQRTGASLVHYTPDPQLTHHQSRHFDACIPLYDMLVTTKPFEMELYKAAGARDVMLVLQGFDDRFTPIAPPADLLSELGSDVCFIGHCESHYGGRLKAAKRAARRLRIWGPGWPRYTHLHPWARSHVVADGIWGARYPLALACSKIALGLLSKRIPETTTTRTFEIPAMGVFMLAERTDDHLSLFKEGIEAEFFGSDDELQDKIRYYLSHDKTRERIAVAGRKRSLRGKYNSRDQLLKVLDRMVSTSVESS